MKYLVILLFFITSISFSNEFINRKLTTTYVCANRDFAVNDLENRLDLTRIAFSVTSNNSIIELYTNKNKGNWLIMITGIDKITCGLIGGQQEFIFE